MPISETIKKELPSKKFTVVTGIVLIVVAGVLIVSSYFASSTIFSRSINKNAPVESSGTVADIITRDTNGNGISDWEETLWGLDPKGNGEENKKTITAKKAAAG